MKRVASTVRAMPVLPTEDEARLANIAWFSRLSPSQKAVASEMDRGMVERARRFFRAWGAKHLR